jgi:uncharacterized membrane protein
LSLHFNWRVEAHPVLVHFPIALLCLAFVFDAIGLVRHSGSFRSAGLYCLVTGAIGAALAVLSGWITPEAREGEGREGLAGGLHPHLPSISRFFSGRLVQVHEHWGYVLLAMVVLWLAARAGAELNKSRRPGLAMVAGAVALAVLFITGYYGGELVYRERGRERGASLVPPPVVAVRASDSLRRNGEILGPERGVPADREVRIL